MRLKIWEAKDGWRWHVKARNGRIVAESGEAYTRECDLHRAILAIARSLFKIGGGAVLALIVLTGCTSTKITGPDGYSLKRVSILQKSDIKRIQIGANYLEGYRNDGGAAAFETALQMVMQYQGLNYQLQGAQAQLKAMQDALAKQAEPATPPPAPAPIVTPPVVAPVPTPAPDGGAVVAPVAYEQTTSGMRWDPNEATEDIVLRSVRRGGAGLILDYDAPEGLAGKGMDGGTWTSYAGVQAWVPDGPGRYRGGWFDHLISSGGAKDQRDLKNIADGYWGAGTELPEGTLVNIMASDGTRRSALVTVE